MKLFTELFSPIPQRRTSGPKIFTSADHAGTVATLTWHGIPFREVTIITASGERTPAIELSSVAVILCKAGLLLTDN
jgi:hypothetical protein